MNNTKRIVFLLSIMSFLASCNERVVVINGQKLTAKDSEYGILLFDKFDGGEYHLYDMYQPPLPRDLAQLLVALDIHTKNSFKNHNLKKLLLKQSISATLSTNNLKICTLEEVK